MFSLFRFNPADFYFARHESGISYKQFYRDLIDYGDKNPGSILGRELNFVSGIIDGVIKGNSWEFKIKKFGEVTWTIEEGSF